MGTKVLALMNMGFFVDAALLNKGIYYTSVPCLYKDGRTIKSLVDAGKTMKDMLGHSTVSDEYFDNLKQCELVEVEISVLTNNVSTSQKETIERLRERLRLAENYIKSIPCDPDITIEQSKAWNEYQECLSTTEPTDQCREQ